MIEISKLYGITITINEKNTIDTGRNSSLLKDNAINHKINDLAPHRYHPLSKIKPTYDANNLQCAYIITKSAVDTVDTVCMSERDDLIKNILTIQNNEIQDKMIYRYPNLTLPRSKVDILKDKYNVKIIRDETKADYSIISKKHINSMFERGQTIYNKASIIKYVDKIKESLTTDAECSLSDFLSKISEDSYFKVNINQSWGNDFDDIKDIVNTNILDNQRLDFSYIMNYDQYLEIKNSNKLILDSDVLKICSEDSVELTEEQYNSLDKIFESSDKENLVIGLEVLANCNLEKSLDKAALLYFKHTHSLRYAKNWNTVNVKTLRARLEPAGYLDLYNTFIYPYDKFFKFLKANDAITEFVYKRSIINISKTVLQSIGLSNSDIFKLDPLDIKLSKEFEIKEVDANQLILDELNF